MPSMKSSPTIRPTLTKALRRTAAMPRLPPRWGIRWRLPTNCEWSSASKHSKPRQRRARLRKWWPVFIAMGAINTLLLCVAGPLVALMALTASVATVTAAGAGVWFLFAGASLGLPGGTGTTVLCALGLISAAISMAALMLLAAKARVSGLARYTRLHYRLLTRSPTETP